MSNKITNKNKRTRFFHPIIYVMWGILVLSIVVYIISLNNEHFADFYNSYPGAFVRAVLAHITNVFPISITELFIILLPSILAVSIIFIIRRCHPTKTSVIKFTVSTLTAASMFFSIFVLGFGCGYHGSTLDKKIGLKKKDVAPDELAMTAKWLANAVAKESKAIAFEEKSFSNMPYSLSEMNKKLLEAYDKVCDEYDFIQRLTSRVKPVMLSEAMSYTHITGVNTYFSGEANININFPDYTLPFTAAHEMAHQRGIAREDEANFIAFIVCISSEDPYIRYSGYLNMFEYVAPKLRAQEEEYRYAYSLLPSEVIYEMNAYYNFFKKYQDSTVGEISNTINNGYLQMQGTVGTKSYGMVVDLTVAYFKAKISA